MRQLLVWSAIVLAVAPGAVASQVYFADAQLQACVKSALGITTDPTEEDMQRLDGLDAGNQGITDLTGLEHATNATYLDLGRNDEIRDLTPLSGLESLAYLDVDYCQVRDLEPLRGLVNLIELHLEYNLGLSNLDPLEGLVCLEVLHLQYCLEISDLQPLSGLTRLRTLSLTRNRISDLEPLSGLASLEGLYLQKNGVPDVSALSGLTLLNTLDLRYNQIRNVGPLRDLTHLTQLNIEGNPLDANACAHLSWMCSRNPLLTLDYDPCVVRHHALEISATPGGRVIDPGEGTFVYEYGTPVRLQAEASPSFVFVGWSGTISDTRNPVTVTMDCPHQIRAHFLSQLPVLYVDDDAPGDPRPGDAAGSDPAENGSPEHPFDRIQEAIEVAPEGSRLVIGPGTYAGPLDLAGKSMEFTGIDPNDPNGYSWPVLDAGGAGPVIRFSGGEDAGGVLKGLVLTGGRGDKAGAIHCSGSRLSISNCLIVGNQATDPNGGAVYGLDSRITILHCTLADNVGGLYGGGVYAVDSTMVLSNSIVWGNLPHSIVVEAGPAPRVSFTDVEGSWPGEGNLDTDPVFVLHGRWAHPSSVWVPGDYHLKSRAGRWDPTTRQWVPDTVTSPCIDAGDPNSPFDSEPEPNGSRANLGTYGATAQASLSCLGTPL